MCSVTSIPSTFRKDEGGRFSTFKKASRNSLMTLCASYSASIVLTGKCSPMTAMTLSAEIFAEFFPLDLSLAKSKACAFHMALSSTVGATNSLMTVPFKILLLKAGCWLILLAFLEAIRPRLLSCEYMMQVVLSAMSM